MDFFVCFLNFVKKERMTTIELKKQVIGKISLLSDFELLKDVYKLLENSSYDSEVYSLTDNYKAAGKI